MKVTKNKKGVVAVQGLSIFKTVVGRYFIAS